MSRASANHVNAVELAGQAATIDCSLELPELPWLIEAGALKGTRASARLRFSLFEGHPLVDVSVDGLVVMVCQRCMGPCNCEVAESASLLVVARDLEEVPGGYDAWIDEPEHMSVAGLVQEQLLLGLPLVPRHAEIADCSGVNELQDVRASGPTLEEKQRPFANLRDLLDKSER